MQYKTNVVYNRAYTFLECSRMTNRYYKITNEIRVHAVNDLCMNVFTETRLLDEFTRILSKPTFPGCIVGGRE